MNNKQVIIQKDNDMVPRSYRLSKKDLKEASKFSINIPELFRAALKTAVLTKKGK